MNKSVKESIPTCWVNEHIEFSAGCSWQIKFWRLWAMIEIEQREKYVEDLRRLEK